MSDVLLQFDNLKCGYGDTEIIHGITGEVSRGQTLGVFGRNGVGKTTISRVLIGEIPTLSGSIALNGASVSKDPTHVRRRKGMSYMPQTGMVFDNLTVRENLSLSSSVADLDRYFELFPRLAERLNQQAGSMSGGERKILSFVRVMLEETDLVILDEPSEGVQPENIEKMQACIVEKQKSGSAFVLVEQNLTMLMAVADRYLGLDAGRIVFESTRETCQRDDLLKVLSV